ncbi:MAG: hypothetical protein A2W09_00735 [Deltaproteobacteria bacterium RBG_16_50_11]|nr:MAG: hypothetical protein A2W09_00735 [Deltaproteobacteria bacterium RBG_16_50_11]
MKILGIFFILLVFLFSPFLSHVPEGKEIPSSESPPTQTAQQGKEPAASQKGIEEYEREKLARFKKNIGKRFLAVKSTTRPPEFYDSPEQSTKTLKYRDKEEFAILEVVQNQAGTMYFYKVRFESGIEGYLGADAYPLDLRVKEGSLIPVTKRRVVKPSPASSAIDLVKNHSLPADSKEGEGKSVEKRMIDAKATAYPKLKWKYEAKRIGSGLYRVTQYVEGESELPVARTWTVNPSTGKVQPENLAAKELYR